MIFNVCFIYTIFQCLVRSKAATMKFYLQSCIQMSTLLTNMTAMNIDACNIYKAIQIMIEIEQNYYFNNI